MYFLNKTSKHYLAIGTSTHFAVPVMSAVVVITPIAYLMKVTAEIEEPSAAVTDVNENQHLCCLILNQIWKLCQGAAPRPGPCDLSPSFPSSFPIYTFLSDNVTESQKTNFHIKNASFRNNLRLSLIFSFYQSHVFEFVFVRFLGRYNIGIEQNAFRVNNILFLVFQIYCKFATFWAMR